ncbi:LmeA family phospholipid-binding protein [Prochlorothrix hollandica]|uniref:DUF2993 domain-containing protein n=1 Tax=Prochlorothrix hollandica PCC 9006 = CALU 1027 TaxID=317619 RepID=A0A0M2Q1D3_PROHO|nr:DUF2993 domain-containing protein [Prochlorothrix hollandica]KKJ00432.1 hypothetical protein PROH_12425 [Prochlorothrix hollandica PCC 9006 = CALU 1027]
MISTVFGSLPFPNQGGDRVVSKVVTAAISALFKRSEQLEVNVRAEPVAKLLQGSVDGFDFIGKGLLMHSGLRVDAMELYVQAVAIDFGAIFTGKVKLKQPIQASMRVALSETDLTDSFNTPFLKEKLQKIRHQGQPLHFDATVFKINPDRSIRLTSNVRVGDSTAAIAVDITAQMEVENRKRINFVDVTCAGDPAGVELGEAVVQHLNGLLDLDQFALEGMQIRVDQLRLRHQQMMLYGVAHIDRFPDRKGK